MGTNYQPIQFQTPDITGNALDRMMQLAQQQRQKQQMLADMLLRRQQFDEQKRQAGVNEQMQQGEAERSQGYLDLQRQQHSRQQDADTRAEAARKIEVRQKAEAAAMQGNYDLARQLMQSIGATYDAPKRYTINQPFVISGKQPGQPAVAEQDAGAVQAGAANVGAFLNGQAPLASRFDAAVPRINQALDQGAQPPRTVTVSDQEPGAGPMRFRMGDEAVTIDPEGLRARQAAQADAALAPVLQKYDSASARLAQSLPGFEKYAEIGRAQLSLNVPPEKALQDAFDLYKAEQANAARLDAAKLRKGSGGGAGGGGKYFALPPKVLQSARLLANDVLRNYDYKGTQGQLSKFKQMADQITAGNAASDAVAAGSFVKMAQGGTGVISDSDMKAFWTQIGSIGVQTADQVSKAINGEMGDDKRRIVLTAVKQLASSAQARVGEIEGAMQRSFQQSIPGATDWAMATYFGGTGSDHPLVNAARHQANQNAANAERVKNGGQTWEDEASALVGGK